MRPRRHRDETSRLVLRRGGQPVVQAELDALRKAFKGDAGRGLISDCRLQMMKYKRFEELPVWNDAVTLAAQISHSAAIRAAAAGRCGEPAGAGGLVGLQQHRRGL
jgi:hypothetical protein